MPFLTLRRHTPTHAEPTDTTLPVKGPDWLIEPTRHASEVVGYDGNSISIPHYESGRLRAGFRETIRNRELGDLESVEQRLATAAAHHAALEPRAGDAIADLCVTGRASLRRLGAQRVEDRIDWAAVEAAARAATLLPSTKARRAMEGRPPLPTPSAGEVRRAVERARAVQAYLAAPEKDRSARRAKLGWIAVSGEDDLPLRPVNVAVTNLPQHDVTLRVWDLEVPLRYVLAGTPSPTSKNVLLLHGHSSRLEEVEHLATGLASRGYVVLALDLPSNGYSGQLDHTHVLFAEEPVRALPLPFAAEPRTTAKHSSLYTLRFLLAVVHRFVEHVFAQHGLPPRIDLVAGGSLGGNLGLLLAALAPWDQPQRHRWVDPRLGWMKRVASWSPACLWNQPNIATGTPHGRSLEPEEEDRRRDHLNRWMNVDHVFPVVIRQAEQWYRKGWPDKRRAIAEGWLARHETYSPLYRRWHWIVAHEQVKFSHQDPVLERDGSSSGVPGYGLVGGEVLLMAGTGDDFPNTHIVDRVEELGPKMPARGHAMVWEDTGHSIHDERPNELTEVLDRFVEGAL
jgi:alpha-beta hydrolase superfamily lysophospholipase